MKLTATVFFVATALIALLLPQRWGLALPFVFGVGFTAYGVVRSGSLHINRLNDVPNALRVFLASLGGYLLTLDNFFLYPSLAVLLFGASLFLNDEYQRRALRSIRTGRKGGSIALLGIDGSGKSSHSKATSEWFESRGYRVELMPFHTYLFVERLASIRRGVSRTQAREAATPTTISPSSSSGTWEGRGGNPLRPVASLVDNLILQLTSSIGCRLEGTIALYDRFIWSTYIKYEALGYPVEPLAPVYLLPRPYFAIILDVPVEKSLRVIDERVAHIHYSRSVLQHERERYLEIARRYGYPVIDATGTFEDVQGRIEGFLQPLFPLGRIGRARGR